MKYVVIHREDFNGHKDSEGCEYFDYILHALGISEINQPDIMTKEPIKCSKSKKGVI